MAYNPTVWNDGDLITKDKLNKIEQGIANEQLGPQGPKGDKGDTGYGMPPGGTKGQFLTKRSYVDYDTEWTDGGNFVTTEQLNKAIQTAILDSWGASY